MLKKLQKKKAVCMVAVISWTIVLGGCGKSTILEDDMSGYVNGVKVINLTKADSYYANGEKMATLYSEAINALLESDVDLCVPVEEKSALSLKGNYYDEAENVEDATDLYIGDIKDEKPDGYGVLFDREGSLEYIGHFKAGRKDGYGVKIASYSGIYVIEYEGELSNGNIADGDTIIPYEFGVIDANEGMIKTEEGNMGTIQALYSQVPEEERLNYAVRLIPEYIGEVKGEEYNGNGILYDIDGSIEFEGKFRNGNFVSED